METQAVALTHDDGEVKVMRMILIGRGPALPFGAKWIKQGEMWDRRPLTDHAIEAEISKSVIVGRRVVHYRRLTEEEAAEPEGARPYRAARVDHGSGPLGYDMVRARDTHRDILRTERKALLEALDIEYQRADEDPGGGAKKQEIAARKQALRDITTDPRIDAATTIDELITIGI
jgi:hypothetical protein